MKSKYLETHHFRKYKEYCSNKCINIVFEQQDIESNKRKELRGMYKGYLYCMKLFTSLINRKKNVPNYELYSHLKTYLSMKCSRWGEDKAIRDVMNLLCDDSIK